MNPCHGERIIQASVTMQSNDVETAPSKRLLHRTVMRTARCQMGELLGYLLRSGWGPLMMRRVKKYNQS